MAENQTISSTKRSRYHRRQIGAFIGILTSIMLLLSILSYSAIDQASGEISLWDLLKVLSNDEAILLKAERTQNWLGLLGAVVSNWFINSTIGFAVIIIPFLGIVWSIYLFNEKNLRHKIIITNYTILLAVLFSSFAGLLRQFDSLLPMEWSGVVGHFIAYVLSKSVGLAGASFIIVGGFIIVLTLLVDLDYKVTWTKLRVAIAAWMEWLREKQEAWNVRHNTQQKEIQTKRAQEAVRIKKPSEELSEQSPARPHVTPINPIIKSAPLKPTTQAIPLAAPPQTGQQADSELTIDIREKMVEAEIDYDDRALETKEDIVEEIDYIFPSVDLLDIH